MKKIDNYIARSETDYNRLYSSSLANPESFWNQIAETFLWKKKWTKTLEYDFNKLVNSLKFSEIIITKNNINPKYTKNGFLMES